MYYIGYILGIIFIIWLLSIVIKSLGGKKDEKPDPGSSPVVSSFTGDDAGGGYSGMDTFTPDDEKDDSWSTEKKPSESSHFSDPAGFDDEIIKAPTDIDLPKTPTSGIGKDASSEKKPSESEKSGGVKIRRTEKKSEPVVRSGKDEPDGSDEKITVILYREDTDESRKRCPYCNTYLTSGNPICEVCGSKVSA